MNITYFRRPIKGVEYQMEEIVATSISSTLNLNSQLTWIAASAPLGAGRPDLVVVTYKPEIFLLSSFDSTATDILAYLFSVNKARLTTIGNRLKKSDHFVLSQLQELVDTRVVIKHNDGYSLSKKWRSILPDITAIEVKVSDWRKAVQQAARNRVLAHSSYIALPENISQKAALDSTTSSLGLGIIEIGKNDTVRVVRPARKSKPRIPSYYFKLAALLATQ